MGMPNDFLSYFNINASLAIELRCSEHLDADQIRLIDESVARIANAVTNGDISLAIGCSKDLSESMAKIAIYSSGNTFASSDTYKSLISMAHNAVDRQPKDFSEILPSFRTIIQAQRNIVSELGTIRNDFGTGHGHARWKHIDHEIGLTVIEAALIWCRWLMRRIDDLLANSPITLRKQLDGGGYFYRGDLTKKLKKIDLPNLSEVDQRAIGVSVARRARTGTYNVSGIDACINLNPAVDWTNHYMLGLVLGLVTNTEGQIYITQESLKRVQGLLHIVNNLPESIDFLIDNFKGMSPATNFEDYTFREQILEALGAALNEHREGARLWEFLISEISRPSENLD
jgi:hypothetical protein